MELPEPKPKTYSVKLDADLTFRLENVAKHLQERPAQLIAEIVEGWLLKR